MIADAAYRIGVDTGGTFTDVVAIDAAGRILTTKTPSTPDDPSRGLLAGVHKVLSLAPDRDAYPLGIYHGTTVATNALLEERFTSLGLITTKGFRHVLEIARQSVPSGYGNSYFWVKPDRIVPLHYVQEVAERLDFRGNVITPFDEDGARGVARWFRNQEIQSIAVCFIHSYANAAHERRMAEILVEEYPSASVSLSSEVLPEYREYERAVTTVVDAFVKPAVRKYVDLAQKQVATLHSGRDRMPFLIMQSNGGVLSADAVTRQPISTLLSGPAAGALGASWLAELAGYPNVLTVDAGGTSTDICVVDRGTPHITTTGSVGRFPVKVPMIDIVTIGTGGGSIAWMDASGSLRVGPRSAGAAPGPMCYGNGGSEPTLTDANVLLGRLPPYLLGGEIPLDTERARSGLAGLGRNFDLSAEQLAAGILEIADWSQVNAIRQVTVKKGLDPRDYALVPFGGSGPLQAASVASLLEVSNVVVPPHPGNVSALGLLAVDLKSDFVTTVVQREDRLDVAALRSVFERLDERAQNGLEEQGVPTEQRRTIRALDLRYFGQAYEIRVDLVGSSIDEASVAETVARFHDAHQRLYGYTYRGTQTVEVVNARISAIGLTARPPLQPASHGAGSAASPSERRPVYFEGRFTDCPIYARMDLEAGCVVDGPAIVQEYGSTTVIHPHQRATVDRYANMVIAARTT